MKLFLFALLALLLVVNAEEATQSDSGIITLRYDEDSYADTWYIPNIGGGLQELTFNIKSGDKLVKGTVGGDTIKALQTDYTALDISKTVDGGSALFINPETYNPIDSATFKPLAQWNNEITVNEDIAIVDRSTAKTEDADFFFSFMVSALPIRLH
jgi:co-chaperonin GroES (HSP10)